VRGGYNFHPNFALEGEASLGITDGIAPDGIRDASARTDWHIGGFAVAKLPIIEGSSVFVRGGYFYAEYSVDDDRDRYEVNFDLDGIAWGGGVEIGINDRNGFRFEFTKYDFKGEPTFIVSEDESVTIFGSLPSLSASYVYRF